MLHSNLHCSVLPALSWSLFICQPSQQLPHLRCFASALQSLVYILGVDSSACFGALLFVLIRCLKCRLEAVSPACIASCMPRNCPSTPLIQHRGQGIVPLKQPLFSLPTAVSTCSYPERQTLAENLRCMFSLLLFRSVICFFVLLASPTNIFPLLSTSACKDASFTRMWPASSCDPSGPTGKHGSVLTL